MSNLLAFQLSTSLSNNVLLFFIINSWHLWLKIVTLNFYDLFCWKRHLYVNEVYFKPVLTMKLKRRASILSQFLAYTCLNSANCCLHFLQEEPIVFYGQNLSLFKCLLLSRHLSFCIREISPQRSAPKSCDQNSKFKFQAEMNKSFWVYNKRFSIY